MTDTQEQTVRAYLAQHAPGLLGALVTWRETWQHKRPLADRSCALLDATEAAGLLDQPQPAPLPAMILGADAFGEGEA